ncbi:MAG: hypothetical protein ABI723_10645 [Bacteroidia bacterium]
MAFSEILSERNSVLNIEPFIHSFKTVLKNNFKTGFVDFEDIVDFEIFARKEKDIIKIPQSIPDSASDIKLNEVFNRILFNMHNIYQKRWNRSPKTREVLETINFVLMPVTKWELHGKKEEIDQFILQ